eukprot:5345339-Lingulodinium_polyedra.AAC.1
MEEALAVAQRCAKYRARAGNRARGAKGCSHCACSCLAEFQVGVAKVAPASVGICASADEYARVFIAPGMQGMRDGR